MEEKLKNLRKSMKNTVLKELTFEKKQMDSIRKSYSENFRLSILQLLRKEKSGTELLQGLRARGITNYDQSEAVLYTDLHELEQKQLLLSRWIYEEKRYVLNRKGLKYLEELEESTNKKFSKRLQELWSGGRNV
ncbi:helix-turn-helix transcriptional regulator [Sutcliffiella horikoshii]|uniref:helix-turn-helix transcriptional regulator n=1 Tax=Sutcliffiella horikoshii TaxID=79883 RepID=UPI001CBD377C|nr:helix-turn-helix transcriptional regulator [Sutcliffiella horikoshii]UAL45548.1 helix-turn-helix transcriptional regulator [Sutcliffiella horikoshii]